MNLENIGKDCPCYEVDCSDIMFDIGEFCGLPPNNGKLTIQVNGSTVGDFSANQQEDETINITTPTSQDIADAVAGEALLRQQADNTLQANIDAEELARQRADREIQAVLDGESLARVNGDKNLQSQIDAIASKSDVVDVVGTYAELQAYDTSKLDDNDVVKVLDDSTHNDSMTYYRWNETTQTWSYIGQESPYYSKSQTDTLLAQKQDNLTAGTGITLNGSTISADTTVLAEKSELGNYAEKATTYTKTEVDNLVEPKLSVEVVEQLAVQGEENKLYLTPKAHTTQTATGNPITATITDDAGQIEDFQLDGDTYQQSYSGKNLLGFTLTAGGGLTASANPDGTINISGTTTSAWPQLTSQFMLGNTIPSGTELTFSITEALPNNATLWIRVYESSSATTFSQIIIGANETSHTTVIDRDFAKAMLIIGTSSGKVFDISNLGIQLEKSSSATSYEPYVGGIASPNPSYPQPIQVVTGEQTVSKVGKNLFDKNNYSSLDAYINSSNVITYGNGTLSVYIECEPNTTYTVSKTNTGTNQRFCVYTTEDRPAVGVTVLATVGTKAGQDTNTSYTITTGANAKYLGVFCRVSSTSLTEAEIVATIQIEKSASATTYAPYSKTDYPISLGSIELCKLGTYQDYIWKDGDTWKVHKVIGKITFDSTTSWVKHSTTNGNVFVLGSTGLIGYAYGSGVAASAVMNTDKVIALGSVQDSAYGVFGINNTTQIRVFRGVYNSSYTAATFTTEMVGKSIYGALVNTTDTEITDATLISQLNAIASASLENGSNTITNTATGSNLAGDMEVDYFGYDPTNRYDKWLWLDINNAYEKLGS